MTTTERTKKLERLEKRFLKNGLTCPICHCANKIKFVCCNPACENNPEVTERTKQIWRERREQMSKEQSERERIAKIRSQYA
jgi:hypothetical protein